MNYVFDIESAQMKFVDDDKCKLVGVTASNSVVVESLPLAKFTLVEYVFSVYNKTQGVAKSFELSVNNDGSDVDDTMTKIKGSLLAMGISASVNGSNCDITVTNNEAYDFVVRFYRKTI